MHVSVSTVEEPDLFRGLTEFPVLRTERLVLRELREDDVPDAFRLFADAEVMRYLGKPPHRDVVETQLFLQRNRELFPGRQGVRWALTLPGEDRFVGSAGHWRLMKEHRRAEIGYDLAPALWGRGLMGEALRAILRFGFDRLSLHSVEAQIDPANRRSRRVLERLGFGQDGLLRENFYDAGAGTYSDTAVFTLLARDFR